jgi:hypothetical protein
MKYAALALVIALLGIVCAEAQPPLNGFYAAGSASTDLVGGDVGYWYPALGIDLGVSGGGGGSISASGEGGLAFRFGVEVGQERRIRAVEARLHGDIGLSGRRFYTLVGLLAASGNSGRPFGVGFRASPGFHLSDHLSLEAFWETISSHPPAFGGQLRVTF